MRNKFEQIMVDTLSGPKPFWAPAGWKYDKTAKKCWTWAVHYSRDFREAQGNQRTRKRDLAVLEAKIEVLCQMLANSLGMATTYWRICAREALDLPRV